MESSKIESYVAFPIQETAKALAAQVGLESAPNLKSVIEEISDAFAVAIATTDKQKIQVSLRILKMHEDYLGEKYRDTPDDVRYIKTVNKAIEYLESQIQ